MATYDASPLTDAQLSHKSPLTIQKVRAMRDNPIAMFEGAAGAPRLELDALERLVAGDTVRSEVTNVEIGGNTGVYTTVFSVGVIQIGTLRLKATAPSGDVQVVRQRAGGQTTVATSSVPLSVDVSVLPGDVFLVQGLEVATPIDWDASASTDGGNLWPVAGANVTGNES